MPYLIEYTSQASEHLEALTAHQRALVIETVEIQLKHQPTVETRNRKKMKPNPIAHWELRIRNLRVYYKVEEEDPEPGVGSPQLQGGGLFGC